MLPALLIIVFCLWLKRLFTFTGIPTASNSTALVIAIIVPNCFLGVFCVFGAVGRGKEVFERKNVSF
jgi:hypothetical protein